MLIYKIKPEIERIMNNNWLNTNYEVKIKTQEEANQITSTQLLKENASIHPIIDHRTGQGDNCIGLSSPGIGSGLIETNPYLRYGGTYINLSRVKENAAKLKTTTSYMLSYIIAHEALHQFHISALVKTNQWGNMKEHTGPWPNLNKDGQDLNNNDINQSMPFPSNLKNRAEWIPMEIKNIINGAISEQITN